MRAKLYFSIVLHIIFCSVISELQAQRAGSGLGNEIIGGRYAEAWLSQAASAQLNALGGWQLNIANRDPALAIWNPALLNANTDGVVSLQQDFMPDGARRSTLAGSRYLDKANLDLGLALRFMDFGDFQGRDERGLPTGEFGVQSMVLGAQASYALASRVRVGASFDMLSGSIASFNAFGLMLGAGIVYIPDTAQATLISLQVQNLGWLLDGYAEERETLPRDVSLAFSRRLRYLPLRFGLRYRNLDRWNLLYDDPTQRDSGNLFGGTTERSRAALWLDNFGRHLGFNAELYLGKKEAFQVRVGYDRQRQQESKTLAFRSLGGLSFGFGVNLKRLRIDYGHTVQQLGGGPHQLGLLFDLRAGKQAREARISHMESLRSRDGRF